MIFRYSSISTAHRCLSCYKRQYIDGVKSEGTNDNLEYGTAIHLALSSYLESKDEAFAIKNFNMYWDGCDKLNFSRYSHSDLREKFDIFFSKFVRLHAKKFTPKFIEHGMEFTVGKHKFQGTPDFIGEYEGIPSIVDFKTSASVYDKKKIIINEQMPIYAHAAKQALDYEAKQLVYVVFVKYDNRIQVLKRDITQKDIEDSLTNVTMICDDLSQRTAFPKNPEGCMNWELCWGING